MRGAIRKRPRLSIPLSSLVLLRLSAYYYLPPNGGPLSLSLSISSGGGSKRTSRGFVGLREPRKRFANSKTSSSAFTVTAAFKPAVFLPDHSPLTTSIQSKVRRCRRLVVDAGGWMRWMMDLGWSEGDWTALTILGSGKAY